MTYNESVKYIHSLLKFGINLGLERISALLSKLGNPQNDLKFVHVAGTNGKGTTSTMMSEILVSDGKKTGLFTSPYVFDFCERIQTNNKNISHSDLAKIVEKVKNAIEFLAKEGLEPTEFEAITAAALLYFKEQKCDFVVLEVGLGGRFDSTNIIPCPEVAIITSISLDHTKILGDTIEKIAFEKSGIIKHGGICVTTSAQDENALPVISKQVEAMNGTLVVGRVEDAGIISEKISGTDIEYNGLCVHIPLVGRHQVENTVGVIEAAKAIGISQKSIKSGIEKTIIHARMEIISKNPITLIDGGHNPECAAALKKVLCDFEYDKKITAVVGMMADKDCEKYLSLVLPLCEKVYTTMPDNPRSLSADELSKKALKYCKSVSAVKNPHDAYLSAKSAVSDGGLLLVCGSFYLLSDIFGGFAEND